MITLTLDQAAAYLKLHPHTVQERARAGAIPGSKPGRRWVFIESDLEAYLRSLQGAACHSTGAGKRGGSTSATKGSGYDAVVRRAIETAHRQFTIRSEPNSGGSAREATPSSPRSKRGGRLRLVTRQTATESTS